MRDGAALRPPSKLTNGLIRGPPTSLSWRLVTVSFLKRGRLRGRQRLESVIRSGAFGTCAANLAKGAERPRIWTTPLPQARADCRVQAKEALTSGCFGRRLTLGAGGSRRREGTWRKAVLTESSSEIADMTEDKNGLLKGYDIDELRQKITQEPFKRSFERMLDRVHEVATQDRQTDKIPCRGWCHSLYFTPMVLEAGFVHRMTGDQVAADHVARQIDKVARVYANPPESFYTEIEHFAGKASAYFTNAHTCMAARMCQEGLSEESYQRMADVALHRLIDDRSDGRYFLTHFNAGHNAVTTHVICGAICALVFGEETGHPEAGLAVELGRDACDSHMHWGYDDQGAPHEGPMYSQVTLEWVYLFADMYRKHGGEDLFKTLPRMEIVAQAASEMQLPGTVGYNGSDDCRKLINPYPMPWLLLTEREYNRPQDLALWQDTREGWRHDVIRQGLYHEATAAEWLDLREILWWDGRREERTVSDFGHTTAFFGLGKAVAVLRSSWSDDAICVNVLGQGRSHNTPDHTHADAGHVSIFAHGELLAYDTAYFNFDEDTHSVILIDDKPFCRCTQGNQYSGRFAATGRDELLDYVVIDAAAAKGCMWALRTVLFIRGDGETAYVVTLDNVNVDNRPHNFKWQLQVNMQCSIDVTGETTAVVNGEKARLDCHFFNPLVEDFQPEPHTLKVFADDHEHIHITSKERETNPRLVAEQWGWNCTLMSLVIPRRNGQEAMRITNDTSYRTFDVKVEHGEFIDRVIYACDHVHVRVPRVRAASEMVVIRRDRSGEVLGIWTIDGKNVETTDGPASGGAFQR